MSSDSDEDLNSYPSDITSLSSEDGDYSESESSDTTTESHINDVLSEGEDEFADRDYRWAATAFSAAVAKYHDWYGEYPKASDLPRFIGPLFRGGVSILCHQFNLVHNRTLLSELRMMGVGHNFNFNENARDGFLQGASMIKKAYEYGYNSPDTNLEYLEIAIHNYTCNAVLGESLQPEQTIAEAIHYFPITNVDTAMLQIDFLLFKYMTHVGYLQLRPYALRACEQARSILQQALAPFPGDERLTVVQAEINEYLN